MPGCLDAWMLEGMEWIGGGDGGDGILGRGDWKKFSHARASGARRIRHTHEQCVRQYASVHTGTLIDAPGLLCKWL